jgi:hypothetical protein
MTRRKLTADDEVRVLGRRRVLKRPDEVDVFEDRQWIISTVKAWKRDGWFNFCLLRKGISRKNKFYLGYSVISKRLTRNKDARVLDEYHPEMREWLMNKIELIAAADLRSVTDERK